MSATLWDILSGKKKPNNQNGRRLSVCDVRNCGHMVEVRNLIRFPPISNVHSRVNWWNQLYGRVNFQLTEHSAPLASVCHRHFSRPNDPNPVPDQALPPSLLELAPVPTRLLRETALPEPQKHAVRTYSRTKRGAAADKNDATSSGAEKPSGSSRYIPIAPAAPPPFQLVSGSPVQMLPATGGGVIQLQLPPQPAAAPQSFQLVTAASAAPAGQSYQLVQASSSTSVLAATAPRQVTAGSQYVLSNGNVNRVVLLPHQQQQQQQQTVATAAGAQTGLSMVVVNPSNQQQVQLQPKPTPLRKPPPLSAGKNFHWSGGHPVFSTLPSIRIKRPPGNSPRTLRMQRLKAARRAAGSKLEIASVESLKDSADVGSADSAEASDDEVEVLDQAWGLEDPKVKLKQEVIEVDGDSDDADIGLEHARKSSGSDQPADRPVPAGNGLFRFRNSESADDVCESKSAQCEKENRSSAEIGETSGFPLETPKKEPKEEGMDIEADDSGGTTCPAFLKKPSDSPPSKIRLKPLSQLTSGDMSQNSEDEEEDDPGEPPPRPPSPLGNSLQTDSEDDGEAPLPECDDTIIKAPSSAVAEPWTPPAAPSGSALEESPRLEASQEPSPNVSICLKTCSSEEKTDPPQPLRVPTPPGISLGDGTRALSEAELMMRSIQAREAQAAQVRKVQLAREQLQKSCSPAPPPPPRPPSLLMKRVRTTPPPEMMVLAKRSRLADLLPTPEATAGERAAAETRNLEKRRYRLDQVRSWVARSRRQWESGQTSESLDGRDQELAQLLQSVLTDSVFWSLDVVAEVLDARSVRDMVAGLIYHFILTERLGVSLDCSDSAAGDESVPAAETGKDPETDLEVADDSQSTVQMGGFSLPQGLSITPLSAETNTADQDGVEAAAAGDSADAGDSEQLTVTPVVSAAAGDSASPGLVVTSPVVHRSAADQSEKRRRLCGERRRLLQLVCCRLCGAGGFSSWLQLDTHMSGQHEVRNVLVAAEARFCAGLYVICRYCGVVTPSEEENLYHMRQQHPKRQRRCMPPAADLFCLACDRVVATISDVLSKQLKPRPLCDPASMHCPSVPAGVPRRKVLRCQTCRIQLRRLELVYEHAQQHAMGMVTSWARCLLCPFQGRVSAVESHVFRAHPFRTYLLGCSMCPEFGTDKWTAAEDHVFELHRDQPPPPLTVCRTCHLTLTGGGVFLKQHHQQHKEGKLTLPATASDPASNPAPSLRSCALPGPTRWGGDEPPQPRPMELGGGGDAADSPHVISESGRTTAPSLGTPNKPPVADGASSSSEASGAQLDEKRTCSPIIISLSSITGPLEARTETQQEPSSPAAVARDDGDGVSDEELLPSDVSEPGDGAQPDWCSEDGGSVAQGDGTESSVDVLGGDRKLRQTAVVTVQRLDLAHFLPRPV